MSAPPSGRISDLAAQIASYLAAHPSACDTAEGVRRWLLAGTDATLTEISAALEQLVQLGRVERLSQPAGTVFRAGHAANATLHPTGELKRQPLMAERPAPIDVARAHLHTRRTFHHEGRAMTIGLLIRDADWRPLRAAWWRGKEVCVIGADLEGNFFLRHCDGTVRYWDHHAQSDVVVATSVRECVSRI